MLYKVESFQTELIYLHFYMEGVMKFKLISKFEAKLPSDLRLFENLILDYSIDARPLSHYSPDCYFIQHATNPGIFGLFRGWHTVGRVKCDDTNVIFIRKKYKHIPGELITEIVAEVIPEAQVVFF